MTKYFRSEPIRAPFHLEISQAPDTLDEAYALAANDVSRWGSPPAAWKLGGTSWTSRKARQVQKPFFGALPRLGFFPGDPARQVEAECALRLGPRLPEYIENIDAAPLAALFDLWAWALELPWSPILNLNDLPLPALVADRCAAGSLVVGKTYPYNENSPNIWNASPLELFIDNVKKAEGSVEALAEPPDICAKNFLIEAFKHGFKPQPGQWIATGGLTPCLSFATGAKICIKHSGNIECQINLEH